MLSILLALFQGPPAAALPTPSTLVTPLESRAAEALELEVTYLANEGFLLETSVLKVVIDGFVKTSYRGSDALTKEAARLLTNGKPPFDGRILGLVSHAHPDHFQARIAGRLLLANPGAALVSSPQVLRELSEFAKDKPTVGGKLFPIVLGPGQSESYDLSPMVDASVLFMNLDHAGDEQREIQNYGHLIRVGGLKVLHLGDADTDRALFEPYGLADMDIDLAFIPSWFFASAEGTEIIDELIRPRIQVACHVPPSDLELFTQRMQENNPHVVVFQERMQSQVFTDDE